MNKVVLSFCTDDIYEIKRITLDGDREEALKYLNKLVKRLDEGTEAKMKGPF